MHPAISNFNENIYAEYCIKLISNYALLLVIKCNISPYKIKFISKRIPLKYKRNNSLKIML